MSATTAEETVVRTRRYDLRALGTSAEDVRFAHAVLTDPRVSAPFRWRGATPSLEMFAEELFAPLLLGFVAVSRRLGERHGLVLLTSPDLRDGHAFVSVAAEPESLGTGRLVEPFIATLEFAFHEWPFHKLYGDVDALAFDQFGSVIRLGAQVEGVFREHVYRGGRRLDVTRLAVYRSDWLSTMRPWVRRLGVEVLGARSR